MGKGIHDGHRERVKQEFLKNGFNENTPPHKILEMLLFYGIARKDTNEIAHDLINRFGSVSGVFEAPVEELVKVNGVSLHTASLLKLMIPIIRCYVSEKNEKTINYTNTDDVCDFLLKQYISYTKEVFSVVSFGGNGRMLGFDVLGEGNVSEVNISIREVVETVLKRNAVCAVIAHNHPNGVAVPSNEDVAVTQNIKSALRHINVNLVDHIVIADDDYVSMAQSRLFRSIFINQREVSR